jgi:hypothetical protein
MTQASSPAPIGHDGQAAAPTAAVSPLARRIPPRTVTAMLGTAARAPSIHNTQPWRFAVGTHTIDLYADPARKLRCDRAGREMLISCGAALFGLRLAVRELGYLPAVNVFPDPSRIGPLARVTLGPKVPVTAMEWQMLAALPHRHTHRGAFDPAHQRHVLAPPAGAGPLDLVARRVLAGRTSHGSRPHHPGYRGPR